MSLLRKIIAGTTLGFLALVTVLLINTFSYTPQALEASAVSATKVDIEQTATQLSAALKFNTITGLSAREPYQQFLSWLPTAFPGVHSAMQRELVDDYTALYTWPGGDSLRSPILLAAHYDVVPVQSETLIRWTHPPFDGVVKGGYVWGRGALDNKGALIAQLQAAEQLIAQDFVPERTIMFSFGHDEESGGSGARSVVNLLESKQVEVEWSLDEGSFVFDDVIKGLPNPVASINVAEKGFVNVLITANAKGGHSALPPRQTAVGRLANALGKLQDAPVEGGLTDVSADFFDAIGPNFGFVRRLLFANQWLFRPVLESVLSSAATTNAMLRTTTAPTMLKASPAPNVLPTQASALVNFRIHPRDTVASVLEHVRQVAGKDKNIDVKLSGLGNSEPSPVASFEADGYRAISQAVTAAFGEVITVPGLTVAATDSRSYALIARDSYRINPFMITLDDISMIHGIDERVSLANLERAVRFYVDLLGNQ